MTSVLSVPPPRASFTHYLCRLLRSLLPGSATLEGELKVKGGTGLPAAGGVGGGAAGRGRQSEREGGAGRGGPVTQRRPQTGCCGWEPPRPGWEVDASPAPCPHGFQATSRPLRSSSWLRTHCAPASVLGDRGGPAAFLRPELTGETDAGRTSHGERTEAAVEMRSSHVVTERLAESKELCSLQNRGRWRVSRRVKGTIQS